MLATTLWYVAALALLAGLGFESAAAFARASVQAAADHALEPALHDALADYQNRLGAAIASAAAPLAPPGPFAGTPPSLDAYAGALATLPNPVQQTIPPAAAAGSTPLTIAYAVTPTTITAPSCDPSTVSNGADAIGWLQCGGFVQESRVSLHVQLTVSDAAGTTILARRDAFVTLRLFAAPPYSAIVGRKDGGAADPAGTGRAAHEGDVGGATLGTMIHVRYACTDGAGSCANAAPPDPDGALQAGARWTNGNLPP
jgi:hypothetical protein